MSVNDYHDFTTIDTPREVRKKYNVGPWYINAAECSECGEVVRSRNQHDFRTCKCGGLSVDGGSWYLKRCGKISTCIDRSVRYLDAE